MNFLRLEALLALPLLGLGLWGSWVVSWRAARLLGVWFAPESVAGRYPASRAVLRMLGLVLGFIALLGPWFESERQPLPIPEREVYFLLDCSASMYAQDVSPNRFERARQIILQTLPSLKGDRVGLILFTNFAYVQCPITRDLNLVRQYVQLASPAQFGSSGTNLRKALQAVLQRLDETRPPPGTPRSAAVVIVTDGEHHGTSFYSLLSLFKNLDIPVLSVALGSERGARIPVVRAKDDTLTTTTGRWIRDDRGREVVSQRQDSLLRYIAAETGGRVLTATPGGAVGEVSQALGSALQNIPVTLVNASDRELAVDRYAWFLVPAVLAWIISLWQIPSARVQS